MATKKNVLFLCTGNSARSQMAEAFLRHYAGDRFEVHSAGLDPKGIHPYTVRVMDEVGISLEGQSSKPVKQYMGGMFFHYLITLCASAEANCPKTLWARGGVKLPWIFDDPAALEGTDEEKLAEFRRIRDGIDAQIRQWLQELKTKEAQT